MQYDQMLVIVIVDVVVFDWFMATKQYVYTRITSGLVFLPCTLTDPIAHLFMVQFNPLRFIFDFFDFSHCFCPTFGIVDRFSINLYLDNLENTHANSENEEYFHDIVSAFTGISDNEAKNVLDALHRSGMDVRIVPTNELHVIIAC